MPERKSARWKRIAGYAVFSLFSLVFCLFLTFPYDALKARVQSEADGAGLYVRLGSMGPGLFGVTARNVQVSKRATGGEDKPLQGLQIKSLAARPTLFPPGIKVSASLLSGSATVQVGIVGSLSVRVQVDEVNLADPSLKALTGVDMAGRVSGELALKIPRSALPGAKTSEPDLGQASGHVKVDAAGLTVNGGTVPITIAMYGPEPTPVDLPRVRAGDLLGSIKFEKGAGTIERLSVKGQDLEVNVTGTVKLAKRVEYSEPNAEVRMKFEPEFQKGLGLLGAGLSMIGPDPKDPGWRLGRLTGYIGRPNFR